MRKLLSELHSEIQNCLIETDEVDNTDEINDALQTLESIVDMVDKIESENNDIETTQSRIRDIVY